MTVFYLQVVNNKSVNFMLQHDRGLTLSYAFSE